MLYSFNNQYPTEIPFRIRLSNGQTRTDASTFTEEELIDAGYVIVPNKPIVNNWQTLKWVNGEWSIIDKILNEEKIRIKDEINLIRKTKIYQNRSIIISEEPLISIPIDFREDKPDLQNIRDLNQQALLASINNSSIVIKFRGSDDEVIDLSASDMLTLGLEITKIISDLYTISWSKKDTVDLCTTLEELYSIDISSGWD